MKVTRAFSMFLALPLLLSVSAGRADDWSARNDVARQVAESVLARWPDPVTLAPQGWEYNAGIILRGLAAVYERDRDPRLLAYIQRWVDAFVAEDGSIDLGEDTAGHNLDRVQPGVLLLLLHRETGDPRYARAAMWLRAMVDGFPKNRVGGFWHKQKYPDEMWLDGLYMAQPFLVRYGRLFGEPSIPYDTAVRQTLLLAAHTPSPSPGLFVHAWDEDRNAAWADPKTGQSPEVWGRAMGWFLMALVDVLADLPKEHPGRLLLEKLLKESAAGVRATQDPATGLFFQVLNRGSLPDNWVETSASGMFVYAFRRGRALGLLDASFDASATRAWAGLRRALGTDDAGRPVVRGAVEGMSVQKDYAGYVARRRLEGSPHGLCAYLLAASVMESAPGRRQR